MRFARTRVRVFAAVVCAVLVTACGAASGPGSKGASSLMADDGGASATGESAGGAGDAGAKDARPFAGSTAEATELISAAVDKRQSDIGICVREFRTRKKLAHKRVVISFGIDQEGKLLGVTSKGREDAQLKTCVQDALKGAPFPSSHAGVITVTKTYEDIVVD